MNSNYGKDHVNKTQYFRLRQFDEKGWMLRDSWETAEETALNMMEISIIGFTPLLLPLLWKILLFCWIPPPVKVRFYFCINIIQNQDILEVLETVLP